MTYNGLWITAFLSSLSGSSVVAWLTVRGLGRHLADRWLADHKGELDKELEAYKDQLEQNENGSKQNSAAASTLRRHSLTPSSTL